MEILLGIVILAALGFLAKVIWDAAEVHELHKMRAAFSERALEVKDLYKELQPGFTEAENFIDAELEQKSLLDGLEDLLGL